MLALLQQHGRLSTVDLARMSGTSESTCSRRMKRLERDGVIDGYTATLSRRALGFTVTAFVLVTLEKQPQAHTEAFHARVRDEPHVVECHAMSGAYDYLLKIVARDIDHFSELVMRDVLRYPGVQHVESSFSLREIKAASALPL